MVSDGTNPLKMFLFNVTEDKIFTSVYWFAFLEQFKKMYVQKVKEQEKAYNKQVHEIT